MISLPVVKISDSDDVFVGSEPGTAALGGTGVPDSAAAVFRRESTADLQRDSEDPHQRDSEDLSSRDREEPQSEDLLSGHLQSRDSEDL